MGRSKGVRGSILAKKLLITGAGGQLGRALKAQYPEATSMNRSELDIADQAQLDAIDWTKYDVILNAAAYVNADHSETTEGNEMTWKANAVGARNIARIGLLHNIHVIHFSSEYVFDGTIDNHFEDEPFTPLNVYGQTKAAGDIAVSLVPKHHILRTSWVIGEGHNFVKTMKNLADMRIDPKVVCDQFGRLTFVSELVRAVEHILKKDIEPGTYNVSNSGEVRSWADIAARTFELAGHDKDRVKRVTTDEYKADKDVFAPRPTHSCLDLSKFQRTGFVSEDYWPLMNQYVAGLNEV